MNILLTNDDGYNAKGIKTLKKILSSFGNVYIAAPKRAMSAKSVSITLGKPIKVQQKKNNVFVIDGTPADCVAYGLSNLGITFDLLVSGCNHGWNISYDTMYSGTIGACLQALTFRIPAIAFSSQDDFYLLEKYGAKIFETIIKNKMLSNQYLLNVNFPMNHIYNGIKIATQYYRKTRTYYSKVDGGYLALRKLDVIYDDEPNSDCYLLEKGYVTITPLSKSLFDENAFKKLSKKSLI